MFEFLFKYPFAAFRKGQLVLLGAWPKWLLLVLILFAAVGLAFHLRRSRSRVAPMLQSWRLPVIGLLELADRGSVTGPSTGSRLSRHGTRAAAEHHCDSRG